MTELVLIPAKLYPMQVTAKEKSALLWDRKEASNKAVQEAVKRYGLGSPEFLAAQRKAELANETHRAFMVEQLNGEPESAKEEVDQPFGSASTAKPLRKSTKWRKP